AMPPPRLEGGSRRLHRRQRPAWPPRGRKADPGARNPRPRRAPAGLHGRAQGGGRARRPRARRERARQPVARALASRLRAGAPAAGAPARTGRVCHHRDPHGRASGASGRDLEHRVFRSAAPRAHRTLRMRPLDGITVVALEQVIAGPFATRQLADLGARVIKVERPGTGDAARSYDTTVKGLSSHFVWVNRGKESLTLDVKHPRAGDILQKLLGEADVFVQNLAPGAAERLGLGPALRKTHPRLIWCGISGYGPAGPYAQKRAYDLLVQCEAGLLSVTGTPDAPAKAGIPAADIAAGMYAFSSILAALFRRSRTGEGATLDITMLESLGEWMGFPAYYSAFGGTPPPRSGAYHATI